MQRHRPEAASGGIARSGASASPANGRLRRSERALQIAAEFGGHFGAGKGDPFAPRRRQGDRAIVWMRVAVGLVGFGRGEGFGCQFRSLADGAELCTENWQHREGLRTHRGECGERICPELYFDLPRPQLDRQRRGIER